MRFKAKNRFHSEIHTSAMNDIMFFLMLFFLIVSTLVNPNVIKLMLPKASASQTVNKQNITLNINANKEYFLNKEPLAFDELEGKLLEITSNNNEATIILRIDKTLNVQDLVDILAIGNKLKLKMIMATEK